jgi:predicted dehydrogenase
MAKQINWGIIGCGDVTEVKSGPAFSKVAGSKLVAVMRRDAEKVVDYARRHQVEQWYTDASKMMDEAGLNAIYIATPPASHLPYALDALKRGLDVYVEKPVTLNAGESKQLATALKNTNARLTVAHYRRQVPMFLYLKKLLDEQTIGDIRTVQIRMWQAAKPALVANVADNWRVDPALSGGGYFHDLAPHQLDLMLYSFGPHEKYNGYSLNQSGTNQSDDHVCGQIVFKSGVVVNGSWCFNVAESEVTDSCEIIGTKGKITFPFFGKQVSWHNNEDEQTVVFEHPQHIEQPMIERVVAYFTDKAPNPCSIDEAIIVMEMIDAFSTSV